MLTADRVKETSTTTGTGSLTLAGAATQFQSFNTAFGTSANNQIEYAIVGQTGSEWEVVVGKLTGSTTLTRDRVIASSNSNALVSLSAGTKDVFATASGQTVTNANLGTQLFNSMGWIY